MARAGQTRLAVIAAVAACACGVSASQSPPDIAALIARVGDRVSQYYRRAQHVICTELSTVQPIQSNWTPDGFSRTVESELRVEFDAGDGITLPQARVLRDVRRVNGRAPRERDNTDRSGCTDPNPLSSEPLAFLLPSQRGAYRFTSIREGREKDRAVLIIDFMSADRTSKPTLIEDERGHDDCFDWFGPIATRGSVWVDAATYDVLRVERRNGGPVDVEVPWRLQRRHGLPGWVVIERDDLTVRYSAVKFTDPDEVVLLPESIESMTMLRTGLQSIRRIDRFSGYRRFLTAGRVVKDR